MDYDEEQPFAPTGNAVEGSASVAVTADPLQSSILAKVVMCTAVSVKKKGAKLCGP